MNTQLLFFWTKKALKYLVLTLLLLILIVTASIPIARWIKPNDLMPVKTADTLVIDNVHVIHVEQGLKTQELISYNQQLVIQNGKFVAINPAGTVAPITNKWVDAKGAFAVPGLFDMHVHIYERKYLALNLAYGVTSVRAMNGQPENLRWKRELQQKEWLGSNLYLSSPIIDGEHTNALSVSVTTPEQARQQVRLAKQDGYDLVKAYGYLSAPVYQALVQEARKQGIPVAKHGPHPVKGSNWALLKQHQSLEHVEDIFQGPLNYQFDYQRLELVSQKIKQLGVPVVPTLETFDHLTQLSQFKQSFVETIDLEMINPLYFDIMSHYTVSRWLAADQKRTNYLIKENQFLKDIVKSLHQHQVTLLVGSDAGTNYTISGVSTHNEMRLLNEAGLSNLDILRAATINAAQTLEIESRSGSIKVGKTADLVIVKENPLADIGHLKSPYAVVKSGQWLTELQLEQLKQSAKNTQSYYWSVIKLLESQISRQFGR
jgi:imidazolonepropionase-like amidohydrolase